MTKRMLIDATHPEETRVAVVDGTKLEEYDYENIVRKQLKGNIYLVKVTRVEPSLQAAFVDFGGNRHGFLPFPEIHPDYYRIPIADREALLAEERALAAAQAAQEDAEDEAELAASGENLDDEEEEEEDAGEDSAEESAVEDAPRAQTASSLAAAIEQESLSAEVEDETEEEHQAEAAEETATDGEEEKEEGAEGESEGGEQPPAEPDVETVGGDIVDQPVFRSSIKRRYKIQEVIKRNQIMLIQISKEERGNKGAAVTSYISLPGRYCVLMPNSPRGGGVSRKVSNAKDRQRLKQILRELNVPEGMSVILRTAGVARAKAEIKRDLDYLLRLWDQIREVTLKSTAPALIYEEGNLVKRAIRDLYRREIAEMHVAGEEGFTTARDFMKMLMPGHVGRVLQYTDESVPLFFRYQVESQIDAIHNPTVHLKSGGYIVINPTEAMVSIDVNSGRATKGRHIEETALKTNLEAAEEIARQLRLRDLGGLIVIDFIDMEDKRGNRTVEKRLRDAMQNDRARIQLGRISPFGLLEMSRQRLHPSLVETNFETCAHCSGSGLVRTVETTGVIVLRAIEEEGMKGRASEIKVSVPSAVAVYLLNNKRDMLSAIEKRHGLRVVFHADDSLIKPNYQIEVLKGAGTQHDRRPQRQAPVQTVDMSDLPEIAESDDADTYPSDDLDEEGGERGPRDVEGRRGGDDGFDRGDRRRGRRGGRNRRGGRDRGERGERNFGRDRSHNRPHDAQQGQPVDGSGEQPAYSYDQPQDGGEEGQPNGNGHHQGNGEGRHSQGGEGRREGGRRRRGGRNRRGRGGRDRGGDRGGDRNNRDGGFGGEGQQPSASGGDFQQQPASHHQEQAYAPVREQAPASPPAPSVAPVNDSNDDLPPGQNRKGWWKRLTE